MRAAGEALIRTQGAESPQCGGAGSASPAAACGGACAKDSDGRCDAKLGAIPTFKVQAVRQILLFLAFLFGIWWLRRKFGASERRQNGSAAPQPPRELSEKVSPCAHCGVHVPESEGVLSNGRFYCSEEHRRLAERA